jgi:hypothetical protein
MHGVRSRLECGLGDFPMKEEDLPVQRDYGRLFPRVLEVMFPVEKERRAVMDVLSAYGREPWHQERDRVLLGILKLACEEADKLEAYTQLACEDYRDLICAAEYPYSSRIFGLSDTDPEKYRELREKEAAEYAVWLEKVLSF